MSTSPTAQAGGQADTSTNLQRWLTDLGTSDSRVWSQAMTRLVAAGERAVPALEVVVQTRASPPKVVLRTVQVLQRIGQPAARAVPSLLDLLRRLEPRDERSKAVILALAELAPHAPDHRRAVRKAMFDLLAKEQLDALGMLLEGADYFDKCRAIARTQFGPETAADELGVQLAADNPFVREFAAELLAEKAEAGEPTIVALLRAVRGPHPDRFQLEDFPPMTTCLDRRIRAAAARALLRLAPRDARSVEALVLLVERPQQEDRLGAVIAVRHAGAAGAAMLPHLMRMAEKEDELVLLANTKNRVISITCPRFCSA